MEEIGTIGATSPCLIYSEITGHSTRLLKYQNGNRNAGSTIGYFFIAGIKHYDQGIFEKEMVYLDLWLQRIRVYHHYDGAEWQQAGMATKATS